jgi:hypothetical protein
MQDVLAANSVHQQPPAEDIAEYQRQFPQWSIRPVQTGKGCGFTAHCTGTKLRAWARNLPGLAHEMQ